MTSQDYICWCDAVSNTNKATFELMEHRKKNYRWFAKKLREFFSQIGVVDDIHFETDASCVDVRLRGSVTLDVELLSSLPFTFTVDDEEGDILFRLYPDVESYEDIREDSSE